MVLGKQGGLMKTNRELIGKLIFTSTQLRFFEKELMMEPSNLELQDIVIKWQMKMDEVLVSMGVNDFIPLKTIIDQVKI
jgi:hypothetical protein